MRTTLRQAREQSGTSMRQLADRLRVSVPSMSSLERNDERGTAKTETVERALDALGLARWDAVLPAEDLQEIVTNAERIVADVCWTMELEAQTLTVHARDRLVRRLVLKALAERS